METKSQRRSRPKSIMIWALLPLGLHSSPSSKGRWVPKFIKVSHKIMSVYLSTCWGSVEARWCSGKKTKLQSESTTQWLQTKKRSWRGPGRVHTLIQKRCCGVTRELLVPDILRICLIWSCSLWFKVAQNCSWRWCRTDQQPLQLWGLGSRWFNSRRHFSHQHCHC